MARRKPGDGGFRMFWTTLPGVLTGLAALLTAVVAVAGLFHLAAGAGSQTGSGQPTPSGVPSPRSSAVGQKAAGELAAGRLSLKGGDEALLLSGRVGNSLPDYDLGLVGGGVGGDTYQLNAGSAMAPVTGSPDKTRCVSELSTRRDGYEPVASLAAGSYVCLATRDGHVAVLQVVSLPEPGSPQLELAYTVWQ